VFGDLQSLHFCDHIRGVVLSLKIGSKLVPHLTPKVVLIHNVQQISICAVRVVTLCIVTCCGRVSLDGVGDTV